MSVSLFLPHFLTDILLTVDISSSGWASFLKFSGDVPGMSVHQFQIISDFLYVFQSVCCLTSLLKLGYIWISSVEHKLYFSNFQETFLGCFWTCSNYFQISCMSVSPFIASLPYWKWDICDKSSSGWAIFLKFSGDILGMFAH